MIGADLHAAALALFGHPWDGTRENYPGSDKWHAVGRLYDLGETDICARCFAFEDQIARGVA